MKNIFTLTILIAALALNANAQKTYTISSSTSWSSAAYPSYCSSCTFNIAKGAKLTIDASNVSCANCSFTGGNIAVTKDFTCQTCSFTSDSIALTGTALNLQSSTTTFTSVILTATGTGSVNATAPVTMTGSIFKFNGTGFFNNNGGTLTMTSSPMYFYDNTYFLANAGPVNLKSTSSLNASSGNAYIEMNGPQLNVYDNSFIGLASKNNYYFNWGSYYSASNNKTYSTATNTTNCGAAGQNKCVAAKVFGPSTLNSAGIVTGNVLPVVLTGFKASLDNGSVSISWETQEEVNSDDFVIERSADGSNWETIGTVNAKGNSAIISYYSFNDASPLAGNNYYRLQMVDMDGKQSSSAIVHINVANTTETKISIYPNPIVGSSFSLKVSGVEPVIVHLFTTDGKLLYAFSLQGQTQYSLQMPASAPHNAYLAVQVISNGKSQSVMVMNK